MAPRAPKGNKAAKQDGTQRKRPAGADAKPGGSEQPKQMSQAERAYKEQSSGTFDYDLAWHENCVFDLNEAEHGINLYIFADGSAFTWNVSRERSLPREEVLRFLSDALLRDYRDCLEQEVDFVLWIAGEMFTGTPKEAFEAILRLLDPPVEPPKRLLGLIEEGIIRIQLDHEYAKAALSDARMLTEAASHLRSTGALNDPNLKHVVGLIRKAREHLHEPQ